MKAKKIILDTNLWISFLISNNLNSLDHFLREGKITIVFSNALLKEFIEVASRPKFKKYFTKKDIENLLAYFDNYGVLIAVNSNVNFCRDEKDNFLLDLAIDSTADYLITGDNDLLDLKLVEETQILTYTKFMELIKEL